MKKANNIIVTLLIVSSYVYSCHNGVNTKQNSLNVFSLHWLSSSTTIHDTLRCSNPVSGIELQVVIKNSSEEDTLVLDIGDYPDSYMNGPFYLVIQNKDDSSNDTLRLGCSHIGPIIVPPNSSDTLGLSMGFYKYFVQYFFNVPYKYEEMTNDAILFYDSRLLPKKSDSNKVIIIKKDSSYHFRIREDFCLHPNVKRPPVKAGNKIEGTIPNNR